MIDKIIFSKRFKLLRSQNNITMVDVANALQISKQSVHQWDTAKTIPTADKLIDLANYFNVSIDCLVGNGLYAKEGLILQNKNRLIEALDKFYYTDFFSKISQLSDYKFMEILSGIIDDIQISDEDGKLEISIYPLLASDAGKTLSKIVP